MINYKKIKKKLKNIGLINLIYRRYIYPHLYQSEFDLKIIKKLKFRNVVDVGASSGLYTIELAKISEHCFSFEPIIEEYINLKKIVNKNVKLFNYALSDKNENQYLNIPIQMNQQENPRASLKNTFQNQVKVKVKTIKFDDLKNNEIQKNQFNKIDFIKIDVEGFEHNVIKGMKNTIKINEPIMLIEVEKRHNKEYSKIFKYFQKLNYQCFYTNDGVRFKKNKLQDLKNLQNIKNEIHDENQKKQKINYKRKYINNFWFIKKNSKALDIIFN
jgi:FkbM family methyltransferase